MNEKYINDCRRIGRAYGCVIKSTGIKVSGAQQNNDFLHPMQGLTRLIRLLKQDGKMPKEVDEYITEQLAEVSPDFDSSRAATGEAQTAAWAGFHAAEVFR